MFGIQHTTTNRYTSHEANQLASYNQPPMPGLPTLPPYYFSPPNAPQVLFFGPNLFPMQQPTPYPSLLQLMPSPYQPSQNWPMPGVTTSPNNQFFTPSQPQLNCPGVFQNLYHSNLSNILAPYNQSSTLTRMSKARSVDQLVSLINNLLAIGLLPNQHVVCSICQKLLKLHCYNEAINLCYTAVQKNLSSPLLFSHLFTQLGRMKNKTLQSDLTEAAINLLLQCEYYSRDHVYNKALTALSQCNSPNVSLANELVQLLNTNNDSNDRTFSIMINILADSETPDPLQIKGYLDDAISAGVASPWTVCSVFRALSKMYAPDFILAEQIYEQAKNASLLDNASCASYLNLLSTAICPNIDKVQEVLVLTRSQGYFTTFIYNSAIQAIARTPRPSHALIDQLVAEATSYHCADRITFQTLLKLSAKTNHYADRVLKIIDMAIAAQYTDAPLVTSALDVLRERNHRDSQVVIQLYNKLATSGVVINHTTNELFATHLKEVCCLKKEKITQLLPSLNDQFPMRGNNSSYGRFHRPLNQDPEITTDQNVITNGAYQVKKS